MAHRTARRQYARRAARNGSLRFAAGRCSSSISEQSGCGPEGRGFNPVTLLSPEAESPTRFRALHILYRSAGRAESEPRGRRPDARLPVRSGRGSGDVSLSAFILFALFLPGWGHLVLVASVQLGAVLTAAVLVPLMLDGGGSSAGRSSTRGAREELEMGRWSIMVAVPLLGWAVLPAYFHPLRHQPETGRPCTRPRLAVLRERELRVPVGRADVHLHLLRPAAGSWMLNRTRDCTWWRCTLFVHRVRGDQYTPTTRSGCGSSCTDRPLPLNALLCSRHRARPCTDSRLPRTDLPASAAR